jgi:hypothetical protein
MLCKLVWIRKHFLKLLLCPRRTNHFAKYCFCHFLTSVDFTSVIYQCLNTLAARFMLTQLAKKLLIFSQIHSIPHETRTGKSRDSVVTVLCGFEAFTPCGFQTMDNKHCRSFGQWMLKDFGRFSVQGSPLSPASSKEEQASTKGNPPMDWLTM